MRALPKNKSDHKELERLNVAPWMVEYLKLNPDYPHWGPGEDYMAGSESNGWSASLEIDGWATFGPWSLDDMNECVHFYFELDRSLLLRVGSRLQEVRGMRPERVQPSDQGDR